MPESDDQMKQKSSTTLILICCLVALAGILAFCARNSDPATVIPVIAGFGTPILLMLRAHLSDSEKKSETDEIKNDVKTVKTQTNGALEEKIKTLIAQPLQDHADALGKIAAKVEDLQQNAVILPRDKAPGTN